jgi:hypothetical protein
VPQPAPANPSFAASEKKANRSRFALNPKLRS